MIDYVNPIVGSRHDMGDIVSVTMDPREDWSNDPEITVLYRGDEPRFKFIDIRYEKDYILYWASDGLLAYFYVQTNDRTGFGGEKIRVDMMDGSVHELIGPWSSRAAVPNSLGFRPCTRATVWRVDDAGEKIGRLPGLMHVMVSEIEKWLDQEKADFYMAKVGDDWIPHPREGCVHKKALYRCPVCEAAASDKLAYRGVSR